MMDLAHPLKIPDLEKLPKLTQPERDRLGKLAEGGANSYYSEDRQQLIVPLLPDLDDNTLQIDLPANLTSPSVKVGIYPVSIHDSYAIDLTRCYDNSKLTVAEIGRLLNPKGCLLTNSVRAFQEVKLKQDEVLWQQLEGEIEGQKQQLAREAAETIRNRNLNILVAMVGTGLSATSLSAAIRQKIHSMPGIG